MHTIDVRRVLRRRLGIHFHGANLQPNHVDHPAFVFARVAIAKVDVAVDAIEEAGGKVELPLICDTRGITIRVHKEH